MTTTAYELCEQAGLQHCAESCYWLQMKKKIIQCSTDEFPMAVCNQI